MTTSPIILTTNPNLTLTRILLHNTSVRRPSSSHSIDQRMCESMRTYTVEVERVHDYTRVGEVIVKIHIN